MLLSAGALLVDVREAREFAAGHAPGAVNIPLSALRKSAGSLPPERDLVVMCRSGHRSGIAVRALSDGSRTVTNLHGGIQAWAAAGHPILTSSPPPK